MRQRITTLILPPTTCAAAGSTKDDATVIPGSVCSVSGADATKGIRLAGTPGRVVEIYNEHATLGLKIYPHSGGDINDGTTDAAISIEGKTRASFLMLDLTTWAATYTANT